MAELKEGMTAASVESRDRMKAQMEKSGAALAAQSNSDLSA